MKVITSNQTLRLFWHLQPCLNSVKPGIAGVIPPLNFNLHLGAALGKQKTHFHVVHFCHLGSIDADDRVGLFESGFVSRAELLQQVNLHWCALLVLVKIRRGGPQHPDIVLIFYLKNRLFRKK